ncbi:MAG TPA: ACP S-malonyltransferase [Candidatus Dormibacteraeota bacterium]|nr:ACP S-malonyltransferase [Candidatus Dormibacteraeota bacterium]
MSLALIFPGQGAQAAGMGRGLFDPGAPAHELAVEAADLAGMDVVGLACDAPDEDLKATDVAQPLILLHSVALLRLLPEGERAAAVAVAGHSLGEYTALVASGALDWREALALVRRRGRAMAVAADGEPQGMSAVLGLDEAAVLAAIGPHAAGAAPGAAGGDHGGMPRDPDQAQASAAPGVVVAANLNAPGQVVISGHLAALAWAAERLKAAGAKRVMPLSVGGAFHSPLMASAAADLGSAIDAAPLRAGRPQAFNLDGRIRSEPGEVRDALRRQLTSAVRWIDCVRSLAALGCDRFVEIGPGAALTAMGKRILPDSTWVSIGDAGAARTLAGAEA